MAEDVKTVTQAMLRKWHESTFPGLDDRQRAERVRLKWLEETVELDQALEVYFDQGTLPAFQDVRGEAADVLLTLMSLAEFLGFTVTVEAIAKHNVNTNRVWVPAGTNEAGEPIWVRERDNRPDLVKDRMNAV